MALPTYGSNSKQEGDVFMFLDTDGGEIVFTYGPEPTKEGEYQTGYFEMTTFYETMALLALLGGNYRDDGSDSTKHLQWAGNEGEPPERQYRSRFQALAYSGIPVTSARVVELEDAAQYDLETAFVGGGYAESVTVEASLKNPKRVNMLISVVTIFNENREVRKLLLEVSI